MSAGLTIRLYFATASSVERFQALVQALDASPLASRVWTGVDVTARAPMNYRLQRTGEMIADAVGAQAAAAGLGDDECLGSYTSLRCWRRGERGMEEGSVVAYVDVWGDTYGRINDEDLRMGGNAAVTLSHVGPFTADITGGDAAYNEKVEENLANLTDLVMHLVTAMEPEATRVFDDQGLRLPFNAHAAYFRRPESVLEDLALLRDVWSHGLPAHRVAPLASYDGGAQEAALHLGRTPEMRRELWERLSAALAHRPTVDDVRAIVASGRFDTLTQDESFVVLEYPHFVNAFVSRFYLEVLERAATR